VMSPRARNGAKRRGSFDMVSGTMAGGPWTTSGSARMRLRGGGIAISLSASSSCVAVATIIKSETVSTDTFW